jgi:hypothetical protein
LALQQWDFSSEVWAHKGDRRLPLLGQRRLLPACGPSLAAPRLVQRIIATSCDSDSLVLDPFGGAGTAALVALQLGHRAITIDIHPAFTQEARERLSDAPANCHEPVAIEPMKLAAD